LGQKLFFLFSPVLLGRIFTSEDEYLTWKPHLVYEYGD